MRISSFEPNVLHCLPTLGRDGYGVASVVDGLLAAQKQLGQNVYISTLDSPLSLFTASSIDIVHQHMIWLPHGVHAKNLARDSRAPLVVTPHGALDPWALSKSYWKKKFVWTIREYKHLQAANCLQATSPFEVHYFRKLGLTQPIATIPNGIDLERHQLPSSGDAEAFLSRHPELAGKRCVLFLSRITAQKGLLPFLEAFKQLKATSLGDDWHFLLAGTDQCGFLDVIKKNILRLNLVTNVTILPPLYGAEKQQAFAFAEIFVLPSLAEGFPMVILEALSAGLPVICSTASPWMQLPGEDAGLWVEPTPEGLFGALSNIATLSPPYLKLMGCNARALVERSFALQGVVSKLNELYKWLLGYVPMPEFVEL